MATFVLDPNADLVASVPRTNRRPQRRTYMDKQFKGGEEEWKKKIAETATVYVGNLSYYTNEYQIHELFGRCGSIRRVIMGLDRFKKTPCGFCFVEFDERPSALKAVAYLHQTSLEGRILAIDLDAGFIEGRQFGRGSSGGQISDERKREQERVNSMVAPGHRLGYQGPIGGAGPSSSILTRSITIVACLTLISISLITHQIEQAQADIVIRGPLLTLGLPKSQLIHDKGRFISYSSVRAAQLAENRNQFEKDLANFLVNLMKASKPTLMKAFITATLADKQLKEIAIGLFFNSTGSDDDSGSR